MARTLAVAIFACVVACGAAMPRKSWLGGCKSKGLRDTATTVKPSLWYSAEDDFQSWLAFARSYAGPCDCHCLDFFSGSSARVAAAFQKRGFSALSYDILRDEQEDLSTRQGFYMLLLKGLRLLPYAVIVGGPPCSLFVFLSSSQHLRHLFGPLGRPADQATQLANLLAHNAVTFLRIMKEVRDPWVILEQPRGSWLLKLPMVQQLLEAYRFRTVSTYLCFWGHQLEKATTLVGDLPGMMSLTRILTKAKKVKYQAIREKKKLPAMYITNADGKVHGTKYLKKSAEYPIKFCNELARIWATAWVAADGDL